MNKKISLEIMSTGLLKHSDIFIRFFDEFQKISLVEEMLIRQTSGEPNAGQTDRHTALIQHIYILGGNFPMESVLLRPLPDILGSSNSCP